MRGGWIAVALSLCMATDAAGYCLKKFNANKTFAAWQAMPVEYRVSSNLTDAKMLAAIDAAFQTWGTVTCSKLKLSKGAQFALASVKFDHATPYIYVFWHTATSTLFDNPKDPKQRYYTNYFVWQDNAGGIVGGSIALNALDYKWNADGGDASTFDLQNAMTYLIGGVIGLTDSTVKGTVMDGSVSFGQTTKRTLTQDDKDGLVYLYKEAACASPPAPDTSSGCSTGTPVTDGGTKKDGGTGKEGGAGKEGGPGQEGGTGKEGGAPAGDRGTTCTSSTQCKSDEVCAAEGVCVKRSSDSGCCRVSHVSTEGGWSGLVLGALLVLVALRRSGRWRSGRWRSGRWRR
jgi:hypothetical protein